MGYLWHELRSAIPLITNSSDGVLAITWVTIKVALISTAAALLIGLPIGVSLGLGRFRGRRLLQILANASLGVPPVLVGVFVLLLLLPPGALGSLQIEFTLRGVYVAQTLLALPYIVALTPAAIRGLPPGLLEQARALGAGRLQLAALALREARIGVFAAVIAALGAALSEVGAVVIVGGNVAGHDQTLASALLQQLNDDANYPFALALGIVLAVLVLALIAVLTLLQQRTSGINLRFRTAS
jgi:tungstate transport system permease protein